MKNICVFCGSNSGKNSIYLETAKELGKLFVTHNLGLVYGGAKIGLMGAIADSVLDGGGQVIGVIPHHILEKEVAHTGLTDLRVVSSMHERKSMMAELSDAFIALPGGFGTLDEFCEILTWAQLGLHNKPMGLLNVKGYYDSLLAMFDHGVNEGFVSQQNRDFVLASSDAKELLKMFFQYRKSA